MNEKIRMGLHFIHNLFLIAVISSIAYLFEMTKTWEAFCIWLILSMMFCGWVTDLEFNGKFLEGK